MVMVLHDALHVVLIEFLFVCLHLISIILLSFTKSMLNIRYQQKKRRIEYRNKVYAGYGDLFCIIYHWGGMVGGLRFMEMLGACSLGSGPVGGTREGCSGSFMLGG